MDELDLERGHAFEEPSTARRISSAPDDVG